MANKWVFTSLLAPPAEVSGYELVQRSDRTQMKPATAAWNVPGTYFVSAGSLPQRRNHEEIQLRLHQRLLRYWVLLWDQRMSVWVRWGGKRKAGMAW